MFTEPFISMNAFVGLVLLTNVRYLNRSSFFFYSDLIRYFLWFDFRSNFQICFISCSFIGIRWFKRLEFRNETAVPTNQLSQSFATVKFWPNFRFLNRVVLSRVPTFDALFDSILLQPGFLSWTLWLDLLFEISLCIRWVLIVCLLFVCDRLPGLRRLLLRNPRTRGSSARQVTLDHIFPTTQFYCIRSNPQTPALFRI